MIVIRKTERVLYVIKRWKVVFACSVSLGSNPVGAKTTEGDGKTPEGKYRICSVNRESKFHISLGISYPSFEDAKDAYGSGVIDLRKLCAFALSQLFCLRPDWSTPLGGFVMIHGESPEGKTGDWTQGCVAATNGDIERIAKLCHRGERVVIQP